MEFSLAPYRVETNNTSSTQKIPSGLVDIRAYQYWNHEVTGKGIVVAIIDTGCDVNHEDLKGQIIGVRNFTEEDDVIVDKVTDNVGHGTHVAGTIAAKSNQVGVKGVAPDVKLLILKVLNKDGQGSAFSVISALNYASTWIGPNGEKVNVINLSLGGPTDNELLHLAVKNAVVEKNILVVCAAGNSGDGDAETIEKHYPGAYPEVVCVGSHNLYAQPSQFMDSNDEIDLVAPGERVYSTYKGNGYVYMSGTSMAAPHVSGAAALIAQKFVQDFGRVPSESELFALLIKSTAGLSKDYDKRLSGHGRLFLTYEEIPEVVTSQMAIQGLHEVGIINTPEFWENLLAKFKDIPEDSEYHRDFRYVDQLMKNMYKYTRR